MKSDARASLDDLAIRWETPRGREIKAEILQDIKHNKGERISDILKDFIYTTEVPDGRDLRCITLEELDLTETSWRKCDLSWASFARSNLTRADFREANLKRANMNEANVSLARFGEADCARVDFTKANLEHANFKEAKMNGAVFVSANCARASFDTANLVKCNFVGANLEQANFSNADCNNGNFSGSGLDQVAAKPAKAWGIVYDMALEEFERKVGLNSLTSRTTKKFKGLDVLLKASAALARVKKSGPQPVADDVALGAPPGMKRLETFKRMDEGGGDVVFGATLKKSRTDEPKPSDVASASDYIDEPSTYDPDDPHGTHFPEETEAQEPAAVNDEAVGAVWTDGRPDDLDAPPPAEPEPAPPPRVTRGYAFGAAGTPATPPAAPRLATGSIPAASPPTPTSGTPIGRTTKSLGPPPGATGNAPGGKFPLPGAAAPSPGAPSQPPSGKFQVPSLTASQTMRLKGPPPPAGSGPAPVTPPVAGGAPPPGVPKASTRNMPRPPDLAGAPPPAPAAPAPKPAPSFVAPLDPGAPDPTADWAKAIGQLMQNKSSITKIVIELGDKSRIVFKKP